MTGSRQKTKGNEWGDTTEGKTVTAARLIAVQTTVWDDYEPLKINDHGPVEVVAPNLNINTDTSTSSVLLTLVQVRVRGCGSGYCDQHQHKLSRIGSWAERIRGIRNNGRERKENKRKNHRR